MTLSEFNFWLDGFNESFIDGAPSKAQWEKIKENLKKIEPTYSSITFPNTTPSTWPIWSIPATVTCTGGSGQLGAKG